MAAETPHTPTSWWHWLLLYPALATTLLGSLPTVWQAVKAWRLDVSYARVQIAEAQQQLWERNLDCLAAKPVYSVELPEGITVGVTLCASGDALLRYESQWGTVSYTWIPFPTGVQARPSHAGCQPAPGVACAQAAGDLPGRPVPPALDQLPGAEPLVRSRIIFGATRCAVLRQGLALRLYSLDGSACWLEHIQVSTGQVVSRVQVPCTTPCPE